jgi:hypothetical protein
VNASAEHLERYNNNPDILERIIAIDETWLKSYDQEMLKVHVNGSYPAKHRKFFNLSFRNLKIM